MGGFFIKKSIKKEKNCLTFRIMMFYQFGMCKFFIGIFNLFRKQLYYMNFFINITLNEKMILIENILFVSNDANIIAESQIFMFFSHEQLINVLVNLVFFFIMVIIPINWKTIFVTELLNLIA